jgi:carbon monoxide dehydrogenase subunit G
MKLEQSFSVQAPIEQVWAALIDIERVAPCLPGAQITGRDEDGAWKGTFTVKLGPTTASYNGVLRMQEVDEAAHRAVLTGRGTDKRGQGGATATIVNALRAEGDVTHVAVDTDFAITGRLARFGRSGMIEDISRRLLRDFAQCLELTLAQQPAAEPEGLVDDAVVAAAPDPAAAAAVASATAAVPPDEAPLEAPPAQATTAPPTRPGATGAPPAQAKPLNGFTLLLQALVDRAKRLLARRRG